MPLLVRKIEKAKWMQNDIVSGEDISADAITNCLKTKENNLSVWKVDTENNVEQAILAIAASAQHIETIDVVLISPEYLTQKDVDYSQSEIPVPVEDLINIHYDICKVTYKKLGIIAYHIADKIREQKIIRFTVGRLKGILKEAIEEGRLDIENLSYDVRKKIIIP